MKNQNNLEKKILKKVYFWEIKKLVFNFLIQILLISCGLIILLTTVALTFFSITELKSSDFLNLFQEDFEVFKKYFFDTLYVFSLEIPREYLFIIFITSTFLVFIISKILKNYYKTQNKIKSLINFYQKKL